jgi:hypothetical protein
LALTESTTAAGRPAVVSATATCSLILPGDETLLVPFLWEDHVAALPADGLELQPRLTYFLRRALTWISVFFVATDVLAQPVPQLTWIPNSSVKLEQIIGDLDRAALAHGTNLQTTSQSVTRFHILANGLDYSFEDHGKLIFLFGDTISENITNWNYHAGDPFAWSPATDADLEIRDFIACTGHHKIPGP